MIQSRYNLLSLGINKLFKKFKLNSAEFKKCGTSGISFILNDRVVKFTTNEDDAINSYNISKYKSNNIINVFDVYKYKIETDYIYIIIMEKAFPLSGSERAKIIKFLNSEIDLSSETLNGQKFKQIKNIKDINLGNKFLLSWEFNSLPSEFLIEAAKLLNCENIVSDIIKCSQELERIGFLHNDIHRYNILKNKNNKFCLIDYGIGESDYQDKNIPELT